MARARNIKPGFFSNDELAEIEPLGRILFAGLWTISDREGRLEDRPKRIKAEILPFDDCDVDKLLSDLEDKKFIIRYEVNSQRYIQILNFKKHQNPHPKEAASVIPPAPETLENSHVRLVTDEQLTSNVITRQESDEQLTSREKDMTRNADSLLPITDSFKLNPSPESFACAREDALPVDKSDSDQDVNLGPDHSGFALFWEKYPKHKDASEAMKAWNALIAQGIPPKYIIQAAVKYISLERAKGTEIRFFKAPQSFLAFSVLREFLPDRLPECPNCRGSGAKLFQDDDGGNVRTETCDCWDHLLAQGRKSA